MNPQRIRSGVLATAGFFLASGCSDLDDPTRNFGLTIEVAPLSLPGLSKVCYDLRVSNEAGGLGSTVWAKGSPSVDGPGDTDAICSNAYGNGAGGAITFVGACDASPKSAGDTSRTNSVTVWVDALYGPTNAVISPTGTDGWQDPCPSGCTVEAQCQENTDTRVEFNLAILRQANQGFFDIGVTFDDIFCSAKVDCVNAQNQPLDLLFNPATGQRDTTIVAALACTAGPEAGSATELYRDGLVVTCGAVTTSLDPTAGPGNAYTAAHPDPTVDAIWQYAVYAGSEDLICGGQSCKKQYWNIAIGLDETADNCTLTTRMTASRNGAFTDFKTPAGTTYPFIDVDVDLTNTNGLMCGKHPVNGNNGVSTLYTAVSSVEEFSHKFDGSNFSDATSGNIITTGLRLHLDAFSTSSYSGTGTTWSDISGNGYTSTLNSPTFNTSPRSFTFDGNDEVQTNFSMSLASSSTPFSVGVWVKVPSPPAASQVILSNRDGVPVPFNIYVLSGGGVNAVSRGNSNVLVSVPSTSTVSNNVWHYCVFTKLGTTFSVYIDGTLEGTATADIGPSTVTNALVIGRLNKAADQWFSGSIAQVHIYDRALSATEVTQNYNAVKARYGR